MIKNINFTLQKSTFFFAVLCFLLPVFNTAQTTTVSGKIVDAETKEPLPFVNIAFKDSKIGTSSDIDGNYSIETYYATDYLLISYVGYVGQSIKIKKDVAQTINVALVESSVNLGELVVVAKEYENPAHPIMRRILANKKINNREKLEAFQYEVYNKVQFDLNNIDEKFTDRKIFKPFDFIFDNIDSTMGKAYLPIFMTESVSDFYYRKNPKTEKEFINATKISGIENESVSQFLGDMYQNVNIYENNINVFGKTFVSPISSFGFASYRYYLMDSAMVGNNWCYKIQFQPKRKQELTFKGDFWVNDTTYAIKEVDAHIVEDANINFINSFNVHQEYEQVEKEVWMITKDKLVIDFNVTEKTLGFFGRKTSSYKNFVINQPKENGFYDGITKVEVSDSVSSKTDDYWNTARHDSLSTQEVAIYTMVDSMKNVPQFRTYVDVLELLISGYKEVGMVDIGPYSSLYSYNPIEGHRFRLGVQTNSKFSKRFRPNAYMAYGTDDKEFKYGGGYEIYLSRTPRIHHGISFRDDVEQLGLSQNAFSTDNFFGSLFRRTPINKLTKIREYKGFVDYEWFEGFRTRFEYRNRRISPHPSPASTLNFEQRSITGETITIPTIVSSELSFYTRFAYKDTYVNTTDFYRVSLGTKYPTIEAQYTLGIKGFLKGEYDYEKYLLRVSDKVPLGIWGTFFFSVEAGKIIGKLPYPLLEIHRGNETFWYDDNSFNTMNFFEFVSDEYIILSGTHHFEGLLLNKIPLLRKLKWREVVSAKAVYGTFDQKNLDELVLADGMHNFERNKPFVEAALGIENIFKVLRVDGLWRLSYLDNPNIIKFGIRAKFQIDF